MFEDIWTRSLNTPVTMLFSCPSCGMGLSAQPELIGQLIQCPGCNARFNVPESNPLQSEEGAFSTPQPTASAPARAGWVETDSANPNFLHTLVVGISVCAAILLLGLLLKGTYIYTILFQRSWVNLAETFVFSWGIAILILKWRILRRQQSAMLLDVIPRSLGREINHENVGLFVSHVYKLPFHLRDSLMVNRIRKGLELFEVRQNNADVAHMMSTQSDIDSVRITGSYSLLKVFLWAIPILGFVGTVLGLSSAIGGFQTVMSGATDINMLMGSLGGVTSGLGTSFDTTLLALVYSIILSFPMSALQKKEDDNLNSIDAYCNETLLPRLNDKGSSDLGEAGNLGKMLDSLVSRLTGAQSQFLSDLNTASRMIAENASNLERRANTHAMVVQNTFIETMQTLQKNTSQVVEEQIQYISTHAAALEKALSSLNNVLGSLHEKQITINVSKPGFFGRLFGKH